MSLKAGALVYLQFAINQTDLLAGTSAELIAPCDGVVTGASVTVQAAVTTGGDITVLTGPAGATTVAGLTVTIADAATKGTVVSDTATVGSTTRKVSKGDRIQVVPSAAFATAGAVNGHLVIATADTSPAL